MTYWKHFNEKLPSQAMISRFSQDVCYGTHDLFLHMYDITHTCVNMEVTEVGPMCAMSYTAVLVPSCANGFDIILLPVDVYKQNLVSTHAHTHTHTHTHSHTDTLQQDVHVHNLP